MRETGLSCPDITLLPRLAEIFDITTDALLGLTSSASQSETAAPSPPTTETDPHEKTKAHLFNGFEFKLDSNTYRGTIGFAVLILSIGVLLLLSRLFQWKVSFWDILWPTTLLVLGLFGTMPRFSFFRLGCLIFGSFFLLNNLNILPLHPGWEMFLPTVLLLLGISLLIDALRKPRSTANQQVANLPSPAVNYTTTDGELIYSSSLGNTQQLVTMVELRRGTIVCTFGTCSVDLSGVDTVAPGCHLETTINAGCLTLLVPACYQIILEEHTDAHSASCIYGQPQAAPRGTILLSSNVSCGCFEIRYLS